MLPVDDEAGGDTALAMIRVPATGEAAGSIFVNPGGPGASGVDLVAGGFRLDEQTMERYHLVGFDPRGVGQSDPIDCGFESSEGPLPDFSPDTNTENEQLNEWADGLAQRCNAAAGAGLAEVGTAQVADDLDVMRAAVGDDQLNYYGFSYGTAIGLHYIERYPDRVGAIVLDGVVDPTQSLTELLIAQAVSFEAALHRMDAACGTVLECPPGGMLAAYDQLAEQLESTGPVGQVGTTELGVATAFAGYSRGLWPALANALTSGLQGDLTEIEAMSDGYFDGFAQDLYTAVECIDGPRPESPEQWDDFVEAAEAAAPRLGALTANDLRPCAFWPVEPSASSTMAIPAGPSAHPILVVGTTGDPATPFRNAETVADALESGILITHEGEGHTAYQSSECVRQLVADYFASGAAPEVRNC